MICKLSITILEEENVDKIVFSNEVSRELLFSKRESKKIFTNVCQIIKRKEGDKEKKRKRKERECKRDHQERKIEKEKEIERKR